MGNPDDTPAVAVLEANSSSNELSFQDQTVRMPFRKILVVYLGIGFALMIAFMDQTSASTATPVIADELLASATISWIGTSFFVGNCAFQLVYGRMSDIFGRKYMLQAALLLLRLGNLLCSFAQTPIQLYVFRAISGIGGGGITNIAMIIVSDVVPLKERGKYQGFISAACSMGSAVGPFLGGGLATAGQWRWLFRITAILGFVVVVAIHFIIPFKPPTGSMSEKVKSIDFLGVLLSTLATALLLVALSGGGSTFAWSSPISISFLTIGVMASILFVINENRWSKLPILPLRMFTRRTPAVVMAQSFLIGMIYYGNIYYVPIFFQYVKGYSALITGALVLAWTFPQSGWGIVSGFYISKTNHYKRVINIGIALWTLGLGLQILWKPSTSIGLSIASLEICAIGIGFNLQTTLIAALATTEDKDRAVVTGGRNFFRTLGAAFGLAIAEAIYQADIRTGLMAIPGLSSEDRNALYTSTVSGIDSLSPSSVEPIRHAFSSSLRIVFIAFTAMSAICAITSLFIQEVEFRRDAVPVQVVNTTSDDIEKDSALAIDSQTQSSCEPNK